MMNTLAETQRAIIRDDIEMKTKANEPTEKLPGYPFGVDNKKDDDSEDHNKVPCYGRGLLFGLVVLVLLAGAIVPIVLFLEKTPDASRGDITKEEVTSNPNGQCMSKVNFSSIGLDCALKSLLFFSNNGTVTVTYRNGSKLPKDALNCKNDSNSSSVKCNITYAVKCSSRETLFVIFHDSKRGVVLNHSINAADPVVAMYTNITQIFTNNTNSSRFELECWYTGACNRYHIGFYAEPGAEIKVTKTCTSTYSDKDGYNESCKAAVSSTIILEHANQSKLYCQLMQGTIVKEPKEELALPFCHDTRNCSAYTTNLSDCEDTSPVLENCTQHCSIAKKCFSARYQELPNSSISCPCALKWCRRNDEYGSIDDTGRLSFNDMCPD